MYHFSKLDIFSNDVKHFADRDGYVPEKDDYLEDFDFPDGMFGDQVSWRHHVNQSVRATSLAYAKLEDWHGKAAVS